MAAPLGPHRVLVQADAVTVHGDEDRLRQLVGNLVETVKGYAEHESATFEKATKARAEAMQASSVADTAKAVEYIEEKIGPSIDSEQILRPKHPAGTNAN